MTLLTVRGHEYADSTSNGVNRSWTLGGSTTSKSLTQTTTGTWVYRVRGRKTSAYGNGTVTGSYSNTDSVSVTLPATLPAPTISNQDNSGNFTVNWTSGGSGVDHYEVQLQWDSYGWDSYSRSTLSTSFTDRSTGTYYTRVRVCKATGCGSWSSTTTFSVYNYSSQCPPFCGASLEKSAPQNNDVERTAPEQFASANHAAAKGASREALAAATRNAGEGASTVMTASALPPARATKVSATQVPARTVSAPQIPATAPPRAGGQKHGNGNGKGAVASGPSAPPTGISADRAAIVTAIANPRIRELAQARLAQYQAGVAQDQQRRERAAAEQRSQPPKQASRYTWSGFRFIKTATGGDGSGYRFSVHYSYDNYGHLKTVRQLSATGPIVWEAQGDDAAGHLTRERFGNDVITTRDYYADSLRLKSINSSHVTEGVIQDLGYQWDYVGNLTQRRDDRSGREEEFAYDSLNRLDESWLNGFTNLDVEYDAAGNIDTRSGTGSYAYNSTRPHAVTSIALDAGGTMTFSYDANGSLLQVGNKTITWTSYRYPKQISNPDNGTVTSFGYGPDRQRYRETIITNGTDIRRVDVLGTLYERIEEHGTITHKHYIKAGSKVVAVHDRRMNTDGSDPTGRLRYLHRDHLGSVDTITVESGAALVRLSYSAYGERREASTWQGDMPPAELEATRDITTRGYTGHQMLDDSGFIHMGGRVYDPFTGRFLSADPNIPDPSDSRSFDRYAYVYNNPLSYTDPSGFVPSAAMIHGSVYNYIPPAVPAGGHTKIADCSNCEYNPPGESEVSDAADDTGDAGDDNGDSGGDEQPGGDNSASKGKQSETTDSPEESDAGSFTVIEEGAPDGFRDDVNTVLEKMDKSGDNSLSEILDSNTDVEIRYDKDNSAWNRYTRYADGTSKLTIFFDSRVGIKFGRGYITSPALSLAHELHHGVRYVRGTASIKNGRAHADDNYIIDNMDRPLSISWGERIRRNHDGNPYTVGCVTCNR